VTAAPARTVYVGGDHAQPICLEFHPAAEGQGTGTAIVICPPFGWDEVCSYRPRREWARSLAAAGFSTARLAFPSTGNSAGFPGDPDRVRSWTDAVATTARWIQQETGARRVVAIGIGLGGLLAYRATAEGAAIDDLVLWATPTRGRALVRQLRAFSRMESSEFFAGLPAPEPLADGQLEAGGFLLSADTIRDLETIDLTTLSLPDPGGRRVLLLGQDGIEGDRRLRDALTDAGTSVAIGSGDGYAAMSSHPQQALTPEGVICEVAAWLARSSATGDPAASGASRSTVVAAGDAWVTTGASAAVRERPFIISRPAGRLMGTLCEPSGESASGLCVVLLNAGGIYRVGPNRMWVEAARRWAARGVPTLRLDVEAIGDSDGAPTPYADDAALYVPELVPQVLQAVDALHEQGVGDRFVLGGLCSGAYWAFQGALEHERVVAAMMLNPRVLVWDPGVSRADDDLRVLRTGGISWAKIKRNFSLRRALALTVWMLGSRGRGSAVEDLLKRFESSGKRALLLFAEDEPLQTDLELSGTLARLERLDTFTYERLAVRDHTLRPTWSQHRAHEALDRALERELTRPGG
jgi:alpha-beta hydrolase superfamily lysophospholipase